MITKKDKILIGLKKSRSLLDKVSRMVEADDYCIIIMQQNLAVMGLLRGVHEKIMRNHLATCFTEGVQDGDDKKKQELIDEMMRVTSLHNR